jgi:hypothetical protein
MSENKKLMPCPSCGEEISKQAKSCPRCGAKIKKPLYKRWWVWAVAVVVVLGIACSGKGDSDTTVNGTASSTSESTPNATEAVSSDADIPVPQIDSTVIYEGNNVVITATGIEKNGNGWNVNLLIENNSTSNLGFNATAYAINGIMTGNNMFSMDCDVAAGKKANAALELEGTVLSEYGITDIRCLDALISAYDKDTYSDFNTGQLEIKTSLYNESHDVIQGTTIFDSNGIKVDYLSNDGDEYKFGITNTTGSYIGFDFDDVTINDFTNSETDYDLYDEVILNNSQLIATVKVKSDFKSANNIDTVNTIEWNMSVRAEDDYFKETKIGPIVYNVQ